MSSGERMNPFAAPFAHPRLWLPPLPGAEGTRQGDPLAGTFFNLGFLHILLGLLPVSLLVY